MPAIKTMDAKDVAALGLATVGAINWGLVGLFKKDLVAGLFGKGSKLTRATYATVGAAGAYSVYTTMKAAREARAHRAAA